MQQCDPFLIADVFEESLFSYIPLANEDDMQACEHSFIGLSFSYCEKCGLEKESAIVESECQHLNIMKDDSGLMVCRECSEEMSAIDFSSEWRYFGNSDNKSTNDNSRCHSVKIKPKGIQTAFEEKNIVLLPAILSIIQAKYNKIIEANGGKIMRSNHRIASIAACYFYAMREVGEVRTSKSIRIQFGLKQKKMSCGLNYYYKAFPEHRTLHIKPQDLIPWFMRETGVPSKHLPRILTICKYLQAASSTLIRSNPQSFSAAILWVYISISKGLKEEIGISKATFSKKVFLSEITISKLVKIIMEIFSIAAQDYLKEKVDAIEDEDVI